MANELRSGPSRVGEIFDSDEETPPVHGTLERSERGISVTVPWSDPNSPYAQWFITGQVLTGMPSGQVPVAVPKRVLFIDSYGSVLLIRCWARGFHSKVLGPGRGTLWARAAIMDVDTDLEFERPHGLQTQISGLRAWLGVTSWIVTPPDPHGTREVTLSSQTLPATEVGEFRGLTVSFQPSWTVLPDDETERKVLLDRLAVVTRSEEPMGWDEHGQIHRAVRDLLVLSRWHPESCVEILALRGDDRALTVNGNDHGVPWRRVVVADDQPTAPPRGYRPHLIRYEELQPAGILRWFALREQYARALDPIISSIKLENATANTLLAHTGPGLEALGYLLKLRDGAEEKTAAWTSLQDRLDRILEDVGDSLPFDTATWSAKTAEIYNGLKHANRAEPEPLDVLNAWRECVLVVRAWVAVELGVTRDDVKERLAEDPQRYPFRSVEI